MPKSYIVILKKIGRKWFLILVVILIIIAIYNITLAIVLTIITLILFLLSYIPPFLLKRKILKTMKQYYRIDEKGIIRESGKNPEKIRNFLFNLSKNQEKKRWLLIYVNDGYIFYHKDLISKYKDLYQKGYGEKKIFEILRKADIETRAEVKKIHDSLKQLDRLEKVTEGENEKSEDKYEGEIDPIDKANN